jgi:hypothetical protein
MKSNDQNFAGNADEVCVEWQPILQTVFTKNDIAEIVAAIRANERQGNDVPSAVIPDGHLTNLSASSTSH